MTKKVLTQNFRSFKITKVSDLQIQNDAETLTQTKHKTQNDQNKKLFQLTRKVMEKLFQISRQIGKQMFYCDFIKIC